jgi:hypothetical protein
VLLDELGAGTDSRRRAGVLGYAAPEQLQAARAFAVVH